MNKCPHADIRFCPLFIESHNTRGLGCVDDMGKNCKVERGGSYEKLVEKLIENDALIVFRCQSAEAAELQRSQRARNMKLNGIK